MRRAALTALVFFVAVSPAFAGSLVRIGVLNIPRNGASATLIGDRVLVAGGNYTDRRLELVDPTTGVATLTDLMTELPLLGHTATRLADGRLLIAGGGYTTDGRQGFGNFGSITADTYDDTVGALIPTGRLHVWRKDHAATRLADGRVLITGGQNVNIGGFHVYCDVTNAAEIFDPATGAFRSIALMRARRTGHTATLLRDGRVLIAGGTDGFESLDSMEIFDPQRETFTPLQPMLSARAEHTATLLANGRVLLAGGTNGIDPSAEIFDPLHNEVTLAGDVGPRHKHSATLLPNGKVLIAGGGSDVIVYNPNTFAIVERQPLEQALVGQAAVLLRDGTVLLIGGGTPYFGTTDVWQYRPSQGSSRRRAVHQ